MDEYLTTQQIADKWNLTPRMITTMCKSGKIDGAVRFGKNWAIPANTEKPIDLRIKSGKYVKEDRK